MGLGELGLMPRQFWSLTIREFQIKHAAFMRSEQRAEWLIGRLAMLTTNYKKPPGSVSRLLGYAGPMNRYPMKRWHSSERPTR